MSHDQTQPKVYLAVVEQIKSIIESNQLGPGDRLPSERELAETLNAGRSSIREALRSLELLGLIETRRGEGTFISDFRNHQLVEILSGFILQSEKAQKDVLETKRLLEVSSIYTLIRNKDKLRFQSWDTIDKWDYSEFMKTIIAGTDNYLAAKIWKILLNFEKSLKLSPLKINQSAYKQLLAAIKEGDKDKAMDIYNKNFVSMSNSADKL